MANELKGFNWLLASMYSSRSLKTIDCVVKLKYKNKPIFGLL
jgi:hypothetical protein